MIVGGKHPVYPHPFEFLEIFGIGAGVGAVRPLPRRLVIVKEKFQVGNADIRLPDQVHQLEKMRFAKGLQAPRQHGVAHHGNGNVTAFCVV